MNTQTVNNAGHLCEDPDTKGFDLQAGQSWIYPTNYPVRDYQYNIIQEALYKNTLVSLPTGLGKTFIAAVVMYNFYRWYPHNKIIFMAPTRPLVKQQMDACYNIMAIPQEVTAELTGTKVQQSRTEIWQDKRVFFITPQVLQNDLSIIIELGPKIKCLVFDEAHRAKGNHAYCEVIRRLLPVNKLFRVLALSATPGNSSRDVIEVMGNLLIAHVEFRSEESADVKPFVFERALETVVVPLGEKLQQIKDQYVQILEKYTRTLIQYKVIYGNCANLTKGKIFMVMKEFQAKNSGSRTPNYAEIMKSLNICITLYHAYETLIRCGLRAFLNFYEEHINNPLLNGNFSLKQILADLRCYLGPAAEIQPLPDGTFAGISTSTKFGHPKFYKLRDILISHFKNSESSTRVIVFFEYRESASEAYALLTQNHPLIKPRVFVGQGSGVTQRNQIHTVKAFREGACNTLLSTCIGEEGLDVGEVDLIVCFDDRMIQRMGRTGRRKEGRVVVLVTEGREQQTLKDCLIYKNNLGSFVTNSGQLDQGKYRDNPQMVPSYIKPQCHKMFITVKKPIVAKSSHLKDLLRKMSADGPQFNEDFEIVEITERIKSQVENFWDKERPLDFDYETAKIDFGRCLEKQRAFQNHGMVQKSKQTEIFVSLLQFADSKRFNIPVTQNKFSNFDQNKYMKQGDIRSMFAKPSVNILSQDILSSQVSDYDKEKDVTRSFPPELFDEISTYLSISDSVKQRCRTCDLLFECPKIEYHRNEPVDLSKWVPPDLSILDNITAKDLKIFADSLSPKSSELCDLLDFDNEIFDDVTFRNEELSPRNFDKILDSFKISEDQYEEIEEKSFAYQEPKSFAKILSLLGKSDYEEVLSFFKLSSLDDLFDKLVDLDATIIYEPEIEIGKSPDLFDQSPDLFDQSSDLFPSEKKPESVSPILCSYERVLQLKAKKKLFQSTNEESVQKPNLSNLHLKRKSFFESTRKTSPKKLDIDDICDLPSFGLTKEVEKVKSGPTKEVEKVKSDDLDIGDICDLSSFGLGPSKTQEPKKPELKLDDLCDMSYFFGESVSQKNKVSERDFSYCTDPKKDEIVDLTVSPEKQTSIPLNDNDFVKSQLSITQMLSLMAKTDSQKENTPTSKRKKTKQSSNKKLTQKKTNTPKRKTFNIPLAGDSEDEFEDIYKSSPIFAKPKPISQKKSKIGKASSSQRRPKKRKRLFCEYIDEEAVLSGDERVSEDEDSGDDCFEASFVADETVLNSTNMHLKYLESVKSPLRGKFKIPHKLRYNVSNVFSQEVNNEDNTYINDSFVVNSQDVDDSCHKNDLSELEILELKLKEMKKSKKRKKSDDREGKKRKRIVVPDDDSD